MRYLMTPLTQPALCKMIDLLLLDRGLKPPTNGHYPIPDEFGPCLNVLDRKARALLTDAPAPEDSAAMEMIELGEKPTLLDSEMASLVLGEPHLARTVSQRVGGDDSLYEFVEKMTEIITSEIGEVA